MEGEAMKLDTPFGTFEGPPAKHGSNLPAGVLEQVERLEGERRDLDSLLRHRVQALIDAARLEGLDVGFRAGRQEALANIQRSLATPLAGLNDVNQMGVKE
jgi:hypothetical protein